MTSKPVETFHIVPPIRRDVNQYFKVVLKRQNLITRKRDYEGERSGKRKHPQSQQAL